MASRKDFVQRSRKQSSASPNRPLAASKPRAKATPPKRKPWALALFSLCALAGLIFILNQLLDVDATQMPTATAPTKTTSTSTQKISKKETISKPVAEKTTKTTAQTSGPTVIDKSIDAEAAIKQNKYEFYELLPKSEIMPAAVEEYKSTPRDAKLDKHYVLQAGSFRNAADAERMRAQLLLSGLPNVHTNQSDGANGIWYRVRIGPFDNQAVMNKANNKLAKLNINAMAIRID
ncbi:SPOR domain-containing protein [Neptunomonas antarctica]|uniref:Sporulation related domain-containing protein n=1 Tax=Neptunomonas antarctica TaxID=619304 RepID=A0A1N7J316_9GAMM|nr:SPOR domain-containing protein [Neptunomonas antarctica]SIS43636.1 Sporulation related domain-containing protein [Neptunomonas antarctica]